jgi:hypothetical protein
MDAYMMEEPPLATPIRFVEEYLQLIFKLRQKMDDQAHIHNFLDNALMDAMMVSP